MCVFKPPKPPDVQIASNPVQPTIQNEAAMQDTQLPEVKQTVDPEEARDVEYGAKPSETGQAAASGYNPADDLKITLGDGQGDTGNRQGGLNV